MDGNEMINRDKDIQNKEHSDDGISMSYLRSYLELRNAIIANCRDCIRDCGCDCLDSLGRPREILKCPLQKVRVEYGMTIEDKTEEFRSDVPDDDIDFLDMDGGDKREVGLVSD
ncbi:MAG: hypothetical protein JSW28_06970 [Thermoplasmata archaeon]|nr:MAG: hypothetical protein JSW28_06970 [Thermoplasmata archaeon]